MTDQLPFIITQYNKITKRFTFKNSDIKKSALGAHDLPEKNINLLNGYVEYFFSIQF